MDVVISEDNGRTAEVDGLRCAKFDVLDDVITTKQYQQGQIPKVSPCFHDDYCDDSCSTLF